MPNSNNDGPDDQGRAQHRLTAADRDWVKRRVAEKRTSVAAIAKAVGMTRQNLYQLLDGTQHATYEWAALVSTLGGTPPSGVPPITDERLLGIVRRWPELSEADKAFVEQFTRRLHGKKP